MLVMYKFSVFVNYLKHQDQTTIQNFIFLPYITQEYLWQFADIMCFLCPLTRTLKCTYISRNIVIDHVKLILKQDAGYLKYVEIFKIYQMFEQV